MVDRYWDHKTPSRHVYVDEVGCVIGTLTSSFTDRTLTATAYDQKIGEFVDYVAATEAVERTCTEIEALRAAEAAARVARAEAQADGAEP
jgi:hypothetical protein